MMTPTQVEEKARKAMEARLGMKLGKGKIDIYGKEKSFDLLNESEHVVGDVKRYKYTKTGKRPSAKISTINEYVWLMQLLDRASGKLWRKFIIMSSDRKLAEEYASDYKKWLLGVKIYFFDEKNNSLEEVV